jgi:riboflavin kinase/FMN adenylyltransferase
LPWEDRLGERLALNPLSIPLHTPDQALRPTAIALGSFDGLHRGHRRVIEAITATTNLVPAAAGGPEACGDASSGNGFPTVVSFWPHPREVLHGEMRLRLDLPEEKLELLEPLGIRQLVMVPFTPSLAALSPEAFVAEVLVGQLQARRVAVGEDFRFGAGRRGNAADLARIGGACDVAVSVLPMLSEGGERVSSSRIRRALAAADLAEAERLLERPYRFGGRVVQGRGLGRGLGWPTANLQVDGRKFLPREGVYAVLAWSGAVRGAGMPAVMNLGPQPTVDPLAPSAVEVHLLDREIDLGGAQLIVQPVRYLRSQQRFSGLKELAARIAEDARQAAAILAMPPG